MATTDIEFYKEIDKLFASYLDTKSGKLILRIRKKSENKILLEPTKINYDKVLFDSELNFYKKGGDGTLTKVEDADFEVVVMQKII